MFVVLLFQISLMLASHVTEVESALCSVALTLLWVICCADFPLECTRPFLAAVLAGRSEPGGVHGEFRAQVASDGFLRAVFMKI